MRRNEKENNHEYKIYYINPLKSRSFAYENRK